MDRRVIKYPLPLTSEGPEVDTDIIEVIMPAGAQIMGARLVDGRAALWALANVERKKMARHVYMAHDHAPLPVTFSGTYIESLALLDGIVIMHLFDLGEREWEMPKR